MEGFMLPVDFRRLMSERSNEEKPKMPRPVRESQILELREIFKSYGECPFKKGDLVTPRANVVLQGAGDPHIVLEVRENPPISNAEKIDTGEWNSGGRPEMRVGVLYGDNETYGAHWVESWQMIPYVEGASESAPANAA